MQTYSLPRGRRSASSVAWWVAGVFYCLIVGLAVALLPPVIALALGLLPMPLFLFNRTFVFDTPAPLLHRLFVAAMVLFILWPRYMSFNVGGPDLVPARLMYGLLLLVWLVAMVSPTLRRALGEAMREHGFWIVLLAIYCFFRIGSVFTSAALGTSLYQTANEMLTAVLVLPIVLSIYRAPDRVDQLLKALLAAALVVALLAVLERALGRTLFSSIRLPGMNVESEWLQAAIMDKSRGGSYRAQSTFSHPLLMAEFLAFALPIAFYFAAVGRRLWRALGVVCIPLFMLAGFLSGSRAAFGVMPVIAFLCFALIQLRQVLRSRTLSGFSIMALLALLLGTLTASLLFVTGVVDLSIVTGRSAAELSSTNTRLRMFSNGIPQVLDRPLFGHGPGLSAYLAGVKNSIALTIDSYYLSLALDSGLVCLVVFLWLCLGLALRAIFGALRPAGPDGLLAGLLAFSVIGMLTVKSILSTPHNAPLVFLCLGLLLVLRGSGRKLAQRRFA